MRPPVRCAIPSSCHSSSSSSPHYYDDYYHYYDYLLYEALVP